MTVVMAFTIFLGKTRPKHSEMDQKEVNLMSELPARQAKLLSSMLTEPTFQAAYKEAGITKTTALRYRASPEFNRAYHEAKRQAMEQVTTELQRRSLEAVAVLTDIMNNDEYPPSARVQSARTVLDTAYKGIELDDLAERLDEVETLLENQKGR